MCACLQLVLGCDADEGLGEDPVAPSTSSVAPSSATWVLDWAPGDAQPLASGWTGVNDLGFTVTVEAGWIGSWGASLVQCADARVADAGLAVATPGLVARGHASGVDDLSAEVFDLVESLTELGVARGEARELDGARYCAAHYLLAPLSVLSAGVEQAERELDEHARALELGGASVLIIGSWTHPSRGAGTFVIRSDQAYGKILELELDADWDAGDRSRVDLVIRRPLDAMFDGVDFELDPADDAGWTVLGNLARGTSVTVEPGDARASEG
ncbi:hypothetical protein ENSA7_41000 [Enhygromyxa salina]|uniref:Uncharacterized protein n=1 Tax=Enhygromyxa salina TaxID=215803 RepID=A0A2S9YM82_9BACT|nr:hypothetical protein ENSA7_41000 [Enhygromyxa salina]